MQNARLDEAQAGIKIAQKAGLKPNIQKSKIISSSPITSWQIEEEKVETVADFMFLGSQITRMVTVTMQSKDTCSLEGKP